ncbi:glycine betaine ABC transporter substrate-binding protein [Halanaerobium sp.]|uniref:glycine betaine ABC transporter substrate-binding protein n=1 Tax=Halanaerobium sp. TaxID=1895664 RepID=UPI000DE773CC|nr:glycine betaine ABC transporter substrate-binding protein [Halanaerobium sp.]PUU93944.1 MAG: glycine betaine ABC transporter substrate-binding protein [Halanaerobium sp.]
MLKKKKVLFYLMILSLVFALVLTGCGQDGAQNQAQETSQNTETAAEMESSAEPEGIRLATTIDFYERKDGLSGLEEAYGFEFNDDNVNTMQVGLGYEALDSNKVDVAIGFATDGRIASMDLRILEDDEGFFPVYNLAPTIRQEILASYPELESLINELPPLLDQETQIDLNKRVAVEEESPGKVAEDFLKANNLLAENVEEKDGPTIAVASKPWTEQLILGNMTIMLLESHGYPVDDRTSLGETAVLRPAIESGEVDMYWEYTGTTLMTTMGYEEEIIESEEAYQTVKEWDQENNNIIWLDYAEANNTFCLLMKEDKAEEMSIEKISDLEEHIK